MRRENELINNRKRKYEGNKGLEREENREWID